MLGNEGGGGAGEEAHKLVWGPQPSILRGFGGHEAMARLRKARPSGLKDRQAKQARNYIWRPTARTSDGNSKLVSTSGTAACIEVIKCGRGEPRYRLGCMPVRNRCEVTIGCCSTGPSTGVTPSDQCGDRGWAWGGGGGQGKPTPKEVKLLVALPPSGQSHKKRGVSSRDTYVSLFFGSDQDERA